MPSPNTLTWNLKHYYWKAIHKILQQKLLFYKILKSLWQSNPLNNWFWKYVCSKCKGRLPYSDCYATCHVDKFFQTYSPTKNLKMMFCVAIWIWRSALTYWNLNSSSKILVLERLLGSMHAYFYHRVYWCTYSKGLPHGCS